MTHLPSETQLRAELEAVPRGERLAWLADLPAARLALFKRLLPAADKKKLNEFIDLRLRERARPSVKSWLADARAGKATSVDAMVDVLREAAERLRPNDRTWLERITTSAPGGNYSRRQCDVIRSLYARYFRHDTD